MKLFDDKRLVKSVRVLVHPNATYQQDMSKDSFVQVLKQQISLLNSLRDDLWFYLILPCDVPSLNFDNVTQWHLPIHSYPQVMRSHVDVPKLQKLLGFEWDFDLVMSHLPEHTFALKNVLYNVTHHCPPVFGWAHWFDLRPVVNWYPSFIQNITGLLEYDLCYINTQHQKDMVLDQARETFNDAMVDRLDDILTVQYLGVNGDDISPEIANEDYSDPKKKKTIVFNHRPDTYKHFKQFIAVCDELWKQRQDFNVWVPLLDKPNREYVITDKGNKQWYYNKLKTCYVGFSPKQKYGGWSVATTDGMMNGVPYIMYDASYYQELFLEGNFFKNDHDALMLLNTYLNDPQYRNEEAQRALDHIRSSLIYKDEVMKMSDYMDDLLSQQKVMGDNSEKLKEIIGFIQKGPTTKTEMMERLGWGRGIKWSPYRRALMNHPNIYDVMDEYPMYVWKEDT